MSGVAGTQTHDWAAQEAETRAVFADLAAGGDLPELADVTYSFVPGPGANWDGFEAALAEAGFETDRCEDEDEDEDEDGEEGDEGGEEGDEDGGAEGQGGNPADPCLVAILPDQPLTALAIWTGERQATELALVHGFVADGWGFWA